MVDVLTDPGHVAALKEYLVRDPQLVAPGIRRVLPHITGLVAEASKNEVGKQALAALGIKPIEGELSGPHAGLE